MQVHVLYHRDDLLYNNVLNMSEIKKHPYLTAATTSESSGNAKKKENVPKM